LRNSEFGFRSESRRAGSCDRRRGCSGHLHWQNCGEEEVSLEQLAGGAECKGTDGKSDRFSTEEYERRKGQPTEKATGDPAPRDQSEFAVQQARCLVQRCLHRSFFADQMSEDPVFTSEFQNGDEYQEAREHVEAECRSRGRENNESN
jgi:hypothetical protein